MRKLVVALLACMPLALASPPSAEAGQCGLPSRGPLWIDVAGGPWWKRVFARPGLILAVSSISETGGPDVPTQLRAAGAKTVHWDLNLRTRVGTPAQPADPATIVERANRLFDYAVRVSGCRTPLIGENELMGASQPAPWSPSNAQYRANVLTFLRTLAARGARPFLAVSSRPYMGGEAAEWWRQVARVADIVRELYFPAPRAYWMGPVQGNRFIRRLFRRGVAEFTSIGIPTSRLGIFLGFNTTPGRGFGGREGLEPEQAWFRVVKWQALAARQVAREMRIGSIWSWGWSSWPTNPLEADPDKEAAACVYIWTRNRRLCNGPARAGPGFNASRTEGQIRTQPGVQCVVGTATIRTSSIASLAGVTGDWDAAFATLLARVALAAKVEVKPQDVLAAERAIVEATFGGSRAAYLAALRRARTTVAVARSVIADELRRARVEASLPAAAPTGDDVRDYYRTYRELRARRVEVRPAAPWLGGKRSGIALASLSPRRVFVLPVATWQTVRTPEREYRVRALGRPVSLGSVPLVQARLAIRTALVRVARSQAFERWLVGAQRRALGKAICRRDVLPIPGVVDLLVDPLDFLAL